VGQDAILRRVANPPRFAPVGNHSVLNLEPMANSFGTDILIQAPDPKQAAAFYVRELGFTITGEKPMLSLHGEHINLFIEQGPPLGPVLEVTVQNVEEAKRRLLNNGCVIVKDEPDVPRCYVKDPFGLIYNLTT
jgi:hypothetical protein